MKNTSKIALGAAAVLALSLGVAPAAFATQPAPQAASKTCTATVPLYAQEAYIETTPGTAGFYTTDADYSESRTSGFSEATSDGKLHIYTTDNSSQAKVALYNVTNFPLSAAGDFSLSYAATVGGAPGGNLTVDLDNDGTVDGNLVIESLYGDSWWLSGNWTGTPPGTFSVREGAPHSPGGGGYPNQGTHDEWVTAYPNATVRAVGFSLGSGILGDGILSGVTAGGVTHVFTAYTAPVDPIYGWVATGEQGTARPSDTAEFRWVDAGTTTIAVECVTQWHTWKIDGGVLADDPQDADDVTWPQSYVGAGQLDPDCEVWYQQDKYVGSQQEIDAVIADGVLTRGEDYSLTNRETGGDWEFAYGGECVEPPVVVPPVIEPPIVTPTPTPTPTATPSAVEASELAATGGGDVYPLIPIGAGLLLALGAALLIARKAIKH